MSRLCLTPEQLELIRRHAEASYPEECCGVLIGTFGSDESAVERAVSVGNEREESRHNRYLISPETVLASHKEARALGLDVIGYYHSHPDHPARPSEFDREHAWPGMSYLIVAVERGLQVDARSWRLSDDRDSFAEEILDLAAPAAATAAQPKEAPL